MRRTVEGLLSLRIYPLLSKASKGNFYSTESNLNQRPLFLLETWSSASPPPLPFPSDEDARLSPPLLSHSRLCWLEREEVSAQ